MPRKKAEPEVLQEETVQPEITDIEAVSYTHLDVYKRQLWSLPYTMTTR